MSESSRRRLGVGVSAVLLGAACWALVVACGDDDERTGFTPDDAGGTDATPQPSIDATFGENDAGACPPMAPTKRAAPSSIKPFQPGTCSPAQVSGYVKECLQSDGNACKAYKAASADCATCVESAAADASWGPIVFYENGQYYDYNYGGCIANVTNDFSATGCGAAQTRYLECRHAACVHCLPTGFPIDYAPFYACQATSATDKLCAAEVTDVGTACAAYFATKPTDACQAAGLPSTDYLRQLITGWCGGSASDAGGDGGDGGDGG
jgi:hypothetical protein